MNSKIKILFIEDSEDDALLIVHQIKKAGYDLIFDRVDSADALKTALKNNSWDLILSDYKMPHFDGLEAIRIFKETNLDLPFIIISGTIGEEVAVEAMKEGAHDYIMKDNLQRLLPAIEREIREALGRAERRKLEEKQKKSELDRLAHLRFFESMDKINRAIQQTHDLEKMMNNVLGVVQEIFDSDRAFLLFPCDPDSPTWTIPMERNKPEYLGAFEKEIELKTVKSVANSFRVLLKKDKPVKFGPHEEFPIPKEMADRFKIKSFIAIALYPKTGKAWEFGLHQCAYERIWSDEDVRLFQEIARRITDALTSLLSYKQVIKSEEKYRLIAENTADVISVFDLNLNRIYISPSIINQRGFTVQEALNQTLEEVLTPESFKKAKEMLTYQINLESDEKSDPNRTTSLELETYHKDGHVIWVELVASFIRDENKKAINLLTITRNITKRKQAELQLTESEQKFRSLAESSPDNILRHDLEGRVIYINRNMELSVDNKSIPTVGKRPEEDIEPPKGYLEKLKKVIKTGEQDDLEVVVQNPASEQRIHHIRFVAERNNKGKIIGAISIGRDITELKQFEESLRISSQALEQSPISIVITNTKGDIEYVNPKFTDVTGYLKEEAIGQNPRILKSGEMPVEFYTDLWNTIVKGQIWQGEFHNKKKSGELYYEAATISPIKDSVGKITHFAAVKEDITERKHLEEQLRQSQKMEAIGQLAGGVAHDFNNMLGVIIGYSELVLMKVEETQEIYSDLLEIRKAANRSADLTRQLLTFARKQTVMLKVINLNETVEGMLKMLHRLISEQIKLNWFPERDLWDIKIDPSQIDQILANLCVNSRDSIDGIGEITISTSKVKVDESFSVSHPGLTQGEYVVLSVCDNGSGMDKKTLNRIFEPFFTTKDTGKGTGLGLSTIYGIVKQNDGHIDVKSELGKGTIFDIYIPRYIEKPIEEKEERKVKISVSNDETILLVEDEKAILDMTKQMLSNLGYKVLATSLPNEAISIAERVNGRIDLLLTDIILPEMNGKTMADKLISKYPKIKCLYMSGYSGDHIPKDENLNIIQKPFSVTGIAEKIRETLTE